MAKKPAPPKPFSWEVKWKAAPVADQLGLENSIVDLLRRHGELPCSVLAMLFPDLKLPTGCCLEKAVTSLVGKRFITARLHSFGGVSVPHLSPIW